MSSVPSLQGMKIKTIRSFVWVYNNNSIISYNTSISIKTSNKEIFRDIEEIQIILPNNIKEVTKEYIFKLYKKMVNKDFDKSNF